MVGSVGDETVLREAVAMASLAPSIHNTQPWQWIVHPEQVELYADRERQLAATDPDGRSLALSCGVALQHARIALAAAGHPPVVERMPDAGQPDLLARIRLGAPEPAGPDLVRAYQSMLIRHTDRRPFAPQHPEQGALDELTSVAEDGGAHLHLVRPDQVTMVNLLVSRAGGIEREDPAYRAELADWTHRDAGDGLPPDVVPTDAPRRVPIRDFAPGDAEPGEVPDAPPVADEYARYAVLYGDRDDPQHWLRGGEALGAVLLAAVRLGLATSPFSDPVEVLATRERLARDVLSGLGHPYLVLRFGVASPEAPPPGRTPRRPAADTTTVELE
ncbi:MAG TPA: nitroreductase [Actinocatenispora sp.]